jgi:hypothetical protein
LDLVYLERVALSYTASATASGGPFFGAGLGPARSDTILADGFGDAASFVHGSVTIGNVTGAQARAFSIAQGHPTEIAVSRSGDQVTLYAQSILADSEVWVGDDSQLLHADVLPVPASDDMLVGSAQWLAISHGMFIPALSELLALRQSEGLSTKVVDAEQIYARYSAGNPDPEAIRRYLADARQMLGTQYVLLVGADTVDAPGYLNSGSVSFIPTPYLPTNRFVQYAPADAALGDTDADGLPDIAVGRLPVRTLAEATEMVRKILAYGQQASRDELLLVAGPNDGAANFAADSAALEQGMAPTWQRSYVYQGELGPGAARQALVDGFNSGQSLISYTGHSGPTRWTFDPLFTISQVTGTHPDPLLRLSENANQPVVLQFACWTTYFVSAQQNSMAQVLLTTPGRGASAVIGATVLMAQQTHQRMASAIQPHLLPGVRIGDALQAAKASIAADPELPFRRDTQSAVVILGDPAQRLR